MANVPNSEDIRVHQCSTHSSPHEHLVLFPAEFKFINLYQIGINEILEKNGEARDTKRLLHIGKWTEALPKLLPCYLVSPSSQAAL